MQEPKHILAAILGKYMPVELRALESARLGDIGIDALDLPMILLDIEDAFAISAEPPGGIGGPVTVGDLVALVAAGLEEKRKPRQRTVPRKKSNWVSTVA